jgi:hypothetical protein
VLLTLVCLSQNYKRRVYFYILYVSDAYKSCMSFAETLTCLFLESIEDLCSVCFL